MTRAANSRSSVGRTHRSAFSLSLIAVGVLSLLVVSNLAAIPDGDRVGLVHETPGWGEMITGAVHAAPPANRTVESTGRVATAHWASVQVAFVLETTPYDGVYDPAVRDWGQLNGGPGDACGATTPGTSTLCEESNGVPVFAAHAGIIAAGIQAANPSTNVSFALVDYSASHDAFDNLNGTEYHVDVASFVSASSFGAAVNRTFVANVLGGHTFYQNSDLSDNLLHSASITALYETIVGNGLNWSNTTHHVIVWMGSTAPRDPSYPEDYCLSPSDFDRSNGSNAGAGPACFAPTCEPSVAFPNGSVPACEAWVVPLNSSTNDSIALLARSAAECTGALGGTCTVDTVDYFDGVTDPYSYAWPNFQNSTGGGPGGAAVETDASNILLAGCDLAAATGGTWAGPSFYTCAQGTSGTLSYSPFGSYASPSTSNPTLLSALASVGFGAVHNSTPFAVRVMANVTSGPAPLSVAFDTVLSNGSGSYAFAWNFGGGTTGVGPSVDHTFPVAGTYDVTVTASNATAQATGLVPIEATGPPPTPLTLALRVAPGAGLAPLAVDLTATPGGGSPPYDLSVCFESGANQSLCATPWQNVSDVTSSLNESFTYPTAGVFTITGTLTEPAGTGPGSLPLPAVATTTVVVTTTSPLRATAQSGTGHGAAPLAVTFQVNVSGGLAPYSLQWSFGDGAQGSSIAGRPVSHVYESAGTFDPSVRVTDATGRSVTVDLAAVHATALPGGGSAGPGAGWFGSGLETMAVALLVAAGVVFILGGTDLRRRARWRREGAALLRAMEESARASDPPRPDR